MSKTAHTPILQAKRTLPRTWAWNRMRFPAYTGAICLVLLSVSAVVAPATTSAAGATVTMPAAATDSGGDQRGGVSAPPAQPENDWRDDFRHGAGRGVRGLRRAQSERPSAKDPASAGQQEHVGRGR